jgi:hypothetical protein
MFLKVLAHKPVTKKAPKMRNSIETMTTESKSFPSPLRPQWLDTSTVV